MKEPFQVNKIFILILFVLPFLYVTAQSSQTSESSNSNIKDGEILWLDNLKCGDCWGWIIKVGSDTIKADRFPNESKLTTSDSDQFPIKIKIEVGKKLKRGTTDYPYYEIKFIELIKQPYSKINIAEIIGFDGRECGCCGGVIIKIQRDTIKADNVPNLPLIKSEELPIKVRIEVGNKTNRCSVDYPKYEIKFLERIPSKN
jgi:hypothetical protein